MRLDARIGAGAASGSAVRASPGAPGAPTAPPASGPPPPGWPLNLGFMPSMALPAGAGLPSLLQTGYASPLAAGASAVSCPAASLPPSSIGAFGPSGAAPSRAPLGPCAAAALATTSAGAGCGCKCSAGGANVSRPCESIPPCPMDGRLTATRALADTHTGAPGAQPASSPAAAAASPAAPGLSSASTADSSAAQLARGTASCRRLGAGAGASAAGQRRRKRGRSSASSSSALRFLLSAWPACSRLHALHTV